VSFPIPPVRIPAKSATDSGMISAA